MSMRIRCALIVPSIAAATLLATAVGGCAVTSAQATAPRNAAITAVRAGARLQAVAFTNPTNGYGLFTATVDHGRTCLAEVAATGDGGRRFGPPQVVSSWRCPTSPPVDALTADSHGDVFAYGPQLFASHDHGTSWTKVKTNGTVLATSAVGRSAWRLTVRCPGHGTTPDSCPLALGTSADGGRSWRPAATQLSAATVPGFGAHVTGTAKFVRTSRATGYVLAGPTPGSRGKHDLATLWITRNGGASWSRRQVPCGPDGLSASLAVAPSGQLFVACAGQPSAGSQDKTLVSTVNGGRSWITHAACSRLRQSCLPLDTGYLGQIAANSAGEVFLTGPRSSLLASPDSGRSWQLVRPRIGDDGGGTTQVMFFGARGLVLGLDSAQDERPAIWHSSDNGAHWLAVHPVLG